MLFHLFHKYISYIMLFHYLKILWTTSHFWKVNTDFFQCGPIATSSEKLQNWSSINPRHCDVMFWLCHFPTGEPKEVSHLFSFLWLNEDYKWHLHYKLFVKNQYQHVQNSLEQCYMYFLLLIITITSEELRIYGSQD